MSHVGDYIKGPPVTLGRDATAQQAAELMAERNIGSVVIVDEEGRPLGIITERDIVRAAARGALGAKALEVGTSGNLLTASRNDDIYEALRKMRERRVRHLIVVDEKGRAVGVISIRDLLEDRALRSLGDRVWWPPPEE
ncbi:MAG: CBS domain-containing protein [Thermoproteus sp.]